MMVLKFSTDQTLHEISDMKQKISNELLMLLNNHLLIVNFIKIRVLYVILLPILFLRKKHSYDYNKEQTDKMREVNQKENFVAQTFTCQVKDRYVLNRKPMTTLILMSIKNGG